MLLLRVFKASPGREKAGALLFASGTDHLTEEKRADISHCFPVMQTCARTHTHNEE